MGKVPSCLLIGSTSSFGNQEHPRSCPRCHSALTQMGPQEHVGIKTVFLFQAKLFLIVFGSDILLKDFHPKGMTVPPKGEK